MVEAVHAIAASNAIILARQKLVGSECVPIGDFGADMSWVVGGRPRLLVKQKLRLHRPVTENILCLFFPFFSYWMELLYVIPVKLYSC